MGFDKRATSASKSRCGMPLRLREDVCPMTCAGCMFYETAREALERFSRTADHRFFRIRAHTDRPDLLGTDETSPTSIDVRAVPYSAPPHRAADTHLQATAFHRQFARAIGAPALNSVRRCFVFGFEHRRDSNSSSLFF